MKYYPVHINISNDNKLVCVASTSMDLRRTNTKMVMMYWIVNYLIAIPSQMYLTPATTRTTRGHDLKL
jgi:hypothetical protein